MAAWAHWYKEQRVASPKPVRPREKFKSSTSASNLGLMGNLPRELDLKPLPQGHSGNNRKTFQLPSWASWCFPRHLCLFWLSPCPYWGNRPPRSLTVSGPCPGECRADGIPIFPSTLPLCKPFYWVSALFKELTFPGDPRGLGSFSPVQFGVQRFSNLINVTKSVIFQMW